MRLILLALPLLLIACAADADSGSSASAASGERQRLSIPQLARYFPQSAAGFTQRGVFAVVDPDEDEGAVTVLSLTYTNEEGVTIVASVEDNADLPAEIETARNHMNNRDYLPLYRDGGGVYGDLAGVKTVETAGSGEIGPGVRTVLADRFLVDVGHIDGDIGGVSVADLKAFLEASGLLALSENPTYASAGSPLLPEWIAAEVIQRVPRYADAAPEPEAVAPEAEAPVAEATPLMDCDEILPQETVSRILGTSVSVRPTPFEDEGANCNRGYKADGLDGAVLLLVSNYSGAGIAESALGVASDHEGRVNVRRLEGLDGVQYTRDSDALGDMHVVNLTSGSALVELKATSDASDPGTTPEQLEEIARAVASNLAR